MIIRGAVNPVTGIYYYGGSGTTAYLGAFDTNTDKPIGQIGTISGLTSGNGDFAFSSGGLMFIVSSNQIFRLDQTVPTTAGNAALTATSIATLPSGTNSPGIAFSSDGYLYVSNGSNLIKLDPASGQQVGSTLALVERLHPDRPRQLQLPRHGDRAEERRRPGQPGDQFQISVSGGDLAKRVHRDDHGSGQRRRRSSVAGPALVTPGNTYQLGEQASGMPDLSNYTATYACTNKTTNKARRGERRRHLRVPRRDHRGRHRRRLHDHQHAQDRHAAT